jgi:hypothetical protein
MPAAEMIELPEVIRGETLFDPFLFCKMDVGALTDTLFETVYPLVCSSKYNPPIW